MPIYEYGCTQPSCKHRWEVLQRFKEDPVKKCPQCNELTATKLISRSNFVLKGQGWYKDHYGLKKDSPKE